MANKIYNFYTLSASSDKNNIRYVGVTVKSVQERFYGHKYCALHSEKRGLPVHKWMWTHYLKGEDILVNQIDSCDESEWETKEQFWIKYYKDLGYDLMNLDKGGKGIITKEKRSESSINRSIKGHEKPIIALNKDGSFYKEFESIKKATLELNLKSSSSINNVLKGRSKSASGYIWIYKKDYDSNKNYIYSPKSLGIKVYEFDIDGILLNEYPNKRFFDTLKGFSFNGIQNAIKNKTIYHDHYWSINKEIDINEYEKYFNYQEIDSFGNIIELFRTQNEICDKYKISPSVVCIKIKEHKMFNENYICKI